MDGVLKQPRARLFCVAAQLGFDGVELEVRRDRRELDAAAREAGIAVSSLICDGAGVGDVAPTARAKARTCLRLAISDARTLGADGILLPQFDLASRDDAAAVERFSEDVRDCMVAAELARVTVGWENSLPAADTAAIIRAVNSERFRCYFDFANAPKRGADPASEIRELGDLIYQVHAKNTNKQPLDGPGVDLAGCLRALQDIGYDGWIVLETPAGHDPLAAAEHNLRVLRDTLASLGPA